MTSSDEIERELVGSTRASIASIRSRLADALELLSKPDVDWDAVCDLSLDICDLASGLNIKSEVGLARFGRDERHD